MRMVVVSTDNQDMANDNEFNTFFTNIGPLFYNSLSCTGGSHDSEFNY